MLELKLEGQQEGSLAVADQLPTLEGYEDRNLAL